MAVNALNKLAHPIHGSRKSCYKAEPLNEEQKEKEKQFLFDFHANASPMSPEQVTQDPRNKELGAASKQLHKEDFELITTLGTGTFARVWLARLAGCVAEKKDKVFALKVMRKSDIIKLKQIEHIRNERNALAGVAGHPFITTLVTSFADRESLYMLLDFVPGGEIFTYLRRMKKFEENTARFYAAEMVLVLGFLHDTQNIVYRDIKPENILIDAEGHIKLVDFGFAKKLSNQRTYTLCGTPEYLAPEVIRNQGHGLSVDWWEFGILLYEFLCGQPPFYDRTPMKLYESICSGKIRFPDHVSRDARDLIKGVCKTDVTHRLGNSADGTACIKSHPFFKSINWDDLYYRRNKGPIIPEIRHPADASCFDDYDAGPQKRSEYTSEMENKYDREFKDF